MSPKSKVQSPKPKARSRPSDSRRAVAPSQWVGLRISPSVAPRSTLHAPRFTPAFTLIEILVAVAILGLVCATIFSTWTAILRASKTGLEAAAAAQRARAVARIIEESLGSAQSFTANLRYYAFVADNGSEGSLSFVARLSDSFPRSGKFGDLNLRRVSYSVEDSPDAGRQLVLRQCPLLMDFDEDEKRHPVVLARNVREFRADFWDKRKAKWIDEWTDTNSMPPLVRIYLALADNAHSSEANEQIVRIVSLPATAVPVAWQRPTGAPVPAPTGVPPPGGFQNPNDSTKAKLPLGVIPH